MELMTEQNKRVKKTEIGLIPEDWNLNSLSEIGSFSKGKGIRKSEVKNEGIPSIRYGELYTRHHELIHEFYSFIDENVAKQSRKLYKGDILFAGSGETKKEIGKSVAFNLDVEAYAGGDIVILSPSEVDSKFLGYALNSDIANKQKYQRAQGDAVVHIYSSSLSNLKIPLPPNLSEQQAIASALSDVDELIRSLNGLIQKKQAIKKGTMQQLLTGKKRLPGFDGEWEVKTLGEIADCLDNLRIPLNESQRNQMRGNIPYCGANGVMDFVNDYVIDDDIILMAEDGGYFDEYKTRPIAYRMKGKIWVNNHAHILKAKDFYEQSFLFYSLVNKDIQDYITGGTRAKLNKGNMLKIEVYSSIDKEEQKAIAKILSDMDRELQTLSQKREKYVQIKQGMMQELLTGKTRLI